MRTPAARSEQDRSDGDHGRGPYHLFVWLFIALVVYVLGIGPAVKITNRNSDPRVAGILVAFYRPLIVLINHSKIAEKFFGWYLAKVWSVP